MKITRKEIEKFAAKRGITISIQNAGEWPRSRQHAENWNQGGSVGKRQVAFAYYSDGYKAWIEPTESFENLTALFEAVKEIVK